MNKSQWMIITNIALFISAGVQIVTGLAMLSGSIIVRSGLFDLAFKAHKYSGIIFVVLLFVHIYQNWGWIKINILRIGKK